MLNIFIKEAVGDSNAIRVVDPGVPVLAVESADGRALQSALPQYVHKEACSQCSMSQPSLPS